MFYLTTHSTHFIYGYTASDIWLRTIMIVRKETRCRHIGYSYRLTARDLLYASSHRQDSTYHGLCYTSRGALAGTRNSSIGSRDYVLCCLDDALAVDRDVVVLNRHYLDNIFIAFSYRLSPDCVQILPKCEPSLPNPCRNSPVINAIFGNNTHVRVPTITEHDDTTE